MNMCRNVTLTRLGSCVLRNQLFQNVKPDVKKQIVRNHVDYYYRKMGEPHPTNVKRATILGGIFWWWIIWHTLTDYQEVIGVPHYPDPASWTDEELGIPPDDED